ncbi:MAG: ABC transporter ATP-binding protein [Planctomycetes bacterium]|nr:ABC transporter ATP-binding protein [Planctomycetota bacterium]
MNPKLISADSKDKPADTRFRLGQVRRIVGLARPYRRTLALGLFFTVVYAGLHTLSLGAAFPVFKMLLEQEGLRGWADRSIAGERLGVVFAVPGRDESVRVVTVEGLADDAPNPLRPDEAVAPSDDGLIRDLLHQIAMAKTGEEVALTAIGNTGERRMQTVRVGELTWTMRARLWAADFLPPGADSPDQKLTVLTQILIVLVCAVAVASVFRYFGEILIARCVLRSMMDLRSALYDRSLHLPMSFFAGHQTADLVTRFVQDIQEIQRGLMTLFGKCVREPLKAVFILTLACMFDWRITLVMVVVAPLAVLMFLLIGKSVKKANRKLLQAYGLMIGALTTSFQNLRVVKAYTAEDIERERLRKVDWRMFKQQLKLAKLQAFISPMMETLAIGAGSLATVWLAGLVLREEMAISKFVGLGVILSMLFDPLRKLTDVYVRVQRSTAGAERIFNVIDQPVEYDETSEASKIGPLARAIEYVGVSFTYPGAEEAALKKVSLTISRGETIALVGPNGCGKTTLVSMLLRFFTPSEGKILYDDVDIRSADLPSLRKQIGLVSQEAIVFAGTPMENIAYGTGSSDEAGVRDAARRASADEFVGKIPGGFEAQLGERGTTLSGGQRQRLAIARAIFRDAPILIFDEATSQIDTESEQKIQAALKEFSKGRTTIIIAHRLSTIQFADRIVVMEAGRIIDSGLHAELFERCPLYRTLCETQFVSSPDEG